MEIQKKEKSRRSFSIAAICRMGWTEAKIALVCVVFILFQVVRLYYIFTRHYYYFALELIFLNVA